MSIETCALPDQAQAQVAPARSEGLRARLGLLRPELCAWAMHDWANSAMVTTIMVAVFPIYYISVAAQALPMATANSRFGLCNAIAEIIPAVLSPILGAIAYLRSGIVGLTVLLTVAGCTSPHTAPVTSLPSMWQTQVLHGERIGITFGTYNVNGLSNLPGLREDLGRLEFVDVWAMQEVRLPIPAASHGPATQPASTELELILPPGLWHVLYVPVNRETDDACEGQAIVSRWPIERAEVWPLEHSAPKSRVAVAAWIATPRGQVLFVNTDHEVGGWGEWGWPRTSDRRKQVQGLVAKLSQYRSTPVVLAGDFNTCGSVAECTSSEKEIRSLNSSMREVDLRPLGPDFERIATYTDLHGCYKKHVDHLFLSDRFAGEVWEICRSAKGSDHYPVWCRAECDRQHRDYQNNME